MQLFDLSAEEAAFFSQTVPDRAAFSSGLYGDATDFALRLGHGLALTLQARLRAPLQLVPCKCEAAPAVQPRWRVGSELAGLWLARRLGAGGSGWAQPAASGPGSVWQPGIAHVSPALLRTLDAVLAERWLDTRGPDTHWPGTHGLDTRWFDTEPGLPGGLAWQLAGVHSNCALALDLPSSSADMTRWAREIIAS